MSKSNQIKELTSELRGIMSEESDLNDQIALIEQELLAEAKQKSEDSLKAGLKAKTVMELRRQAKELGLTQDGLKSALVNRIFTTIISKHHEASTSTETNHEKPESDTKTPEKSTEKPDVSSERPPDQINESNNSSSDTNSSSSDSDSSSTSSDLSSTSSDLSSTSSDSSSASSSDSESSTSSDSSNNKAKKPKKWSKKSRKDRKKRRNKKFKFSDVQNSLPKFTGEGTSNIKIFIKEFERWATIFKWSNLERLIYAKAQMKETAADFAEKELKPTSYKKLISGLKSEFKAESNTAIIHKKLARNHFANISTKWLR